MLLFVIVYEMNNSPHKTLYLVSFLAVKVGDKAPDFRLPSQVGVSGQSVESHQSFATHYGLPFILLGDEQKKVRQLYGVPSSMGILPGRVTYIIDKKGVVRHIFSSQTQAQGHVEVTRNKLKQLEQEEKPAV